MLTVFTRTISRPSRSAAPRRYCPGGLPHSTARRFCELCRALFLRTQPAHAVCRELACRAYRGKIGGGAPEAYRAARRPACAMSAFYIRLAGRDVPRTDLRIEPAVTLRERTAGGDVGRPLSALLTCCRRIIEILRREAVKLPISLCIPVASKCLRWIIINA
jgi:hypothetical protein